MNRPKIYNILILIIITGICRYLYSNDNKISVFNNAHGLRVKDVITKKYILPKIKRDFDINVAANDFRNALDSYDYTCTRQTVTNRMGYKVIQLVYKKIVNNMQNKVISHIYLIDDSFMQNNIHEFMFYVIGNELTSQITSSTFELIEDGPGSLCLTAKKHNALWFCSDNAVVQIHSRSSIELMEMANLIDDIIKAHKVEKK